MLLRAIGPLHIQCTEGKSLTIHSISTLFLAGRTPFIGYINLAVSWYTLGAAEMLPLLLCSKIY